MKEEERKRGKEREMERRGEKGEEKGKEKKKVPYRARTHNLLLHSPLPTASKQNCTYHYYIYRKSRF